MSATGCATLKPDPDTDIAATNALARLDRFNGDLTTVKALGSIDATAQQGRWRGRFAWAGQLPDHLRASALGPGGRPLITITATPVQTHVVSHHRNKIHQFPPGDRALSRWLGCPLDPKHLLAMLSGRLPLRSHDALRLEGNPGDTNESITALRSRRSIQRIQWTGNPPTMIQVDMISPLGELQWTGRMTDWVVAGSHRFPGRVVIVDNNDNRVVIQQERFWPQAEIDLEIFSP